MNYLFDVDGTLTDARKPIVKEFKDYFGKWVTFQRSKGNKVYLVTGSDRDKTVEQIGVDLWRHVDGAYQNCGNVYYEHGKLIRQSTWQMPVDLHYEILIEIEKSKWYGKADNNIEERIGMVNISTLGRSASAVLRREYYKWDNTRGERKEIVESLSGKFPDLDFSIGGEISIDIYPKGMDKSQAINDMDGACMFFGDRCEKGGNDHSIAINCSEYHNVNGWKETYEILTYLLR